MSRAAALPFRLTRRRGNSKRQRVEHLLQHGSRLGLHFRVRRILDRMRDKHITRIIHAERLALEVGGFVKLR